MTAKKGLKSGLIVSGIFLDLIFLGILIYGLTAYDGHCISFEPPERTCTVLEFLLPYLLFLVVYSLVGKPILAVILFLIIFVPPLVGCLQDKRKSKTNLENWDWQD